jgi:hypothetical protein
MALNLEVARERLAAVLEKDRFSGTHDEYETKLSAFARLLVAPFVCASCATVFDFPRQLNLHAKECEQPNDTCTLRCPVGGQKCWIFHSDQVLVAHMLRLHNTTIDNAIALLISTHEADMSIVADRCGIKLFNLQQRHENVQLTGDDGDGDVYGDNDDGHEYHRSAKKHKDDNCDHDHSSVNDNDEDDDSCGSVDGSVVCKDFFFHTAMMRVMRMIAGTGLPTPMI